VIGPAPGGQRGDLSKCPWPWLRTGAALVIDADGTQPSFVTSRENCVSALDRDDVLTPHPGEFGTPSIPGLLGKVARATFTAG